MASQKSITLLQDYVTERQRTSSSGTKSRFTLTVKSEPISHTLDEVALGALPAKALRDVLSEQIKAISQPVSAGTSLARKYQRTGYAAGKPWATRRFSGGKTGATPPTDSDRMFNNSGRLADGLFIRLNPSEHEYTVNVPANRLDPSTFKGTTFTAMLEKLRELVPGLANPAELAGDPRVQDAVLKTLKDLLIKKQKEGYKATDELLKEGLEIAKQLYDVGEILNGDE